MRQSDHAPGESTAAAAQRAALFAAFDAHAMVADPDLEAITRFAAALCGTETALVSLVEAHRQWFPARHGLDVGETPRDTSFCAHAMSLGDIMVVEDATHDPRFADNPLVTGAPHIRFYAGAPLLSQEGTPLGALCVIDPRPRPDGLTALQLEGLRVLACDVMHRFGTRRVAKLRLAIEAERDDSERRFRTLADAMPQMVWSTRPDGFHDYYNARWYEFTGVLHGSTDGDAWSGVVHPEDRDSAWLRWRSSLETGEPYEIEYRLRDSAGAYRWTLGRALPIRDAAGAVTRWFGTLTDIHEQKLAQQQREIVSNELSHRIKNIFSVIAGLIGFTSRQDPAFHSTAEDLRARVMALGRAHDFVRPHSDASRPVKHQTSLHGMLEGLFEPYQSASGDRIVVRGEDPPIDDQSATPFSLVFHELATNAVKYGALTATDGHVTLTIDRKGEQVIFDWVESGGPPLAGPPAETGFGTRLIELSAVRQLGGTLDRDWSADGLRVRLAVPRRVMKRPAAA